MELTLKAPRRKGDWLQEPLRIPLKQGQVTGLAGVSKREMGTLLHDLLCGMSEEQKKKAAYVLTETPYVKSLTGQENEELICCAYPEFDKEAFIAWVERFRLLPDQPLSAYSREKQTLYSLAVALSRKAEILILAVDETLYEKEASPQYREGIAALLEEYKERAVLLLCHELSFALDQIVIVEQGKQIYAGVCDALLDAYRCLTVEEAKYQYLKQQYEEELLLSHAVARNVTMYFKNSERLSYLYGARKLTLTELLSFFHAYHKETGQYLFGEEILLKVTSKYKKIPDTKWKQEAAFTDTTEKKRLPFESPYE